MEITRTSMFTNITRTIDLPITEEQIERYMDGAMVQVAFPNLTPDQREFIRTGVTKEEWDKFIPKEEE